MEYVDKIIKELKEGILCSINNNYVSDADLKREIANRLKIIIDDRKVELALDDRIKIINSIFYSFRGLDILDELLVDDNITEIMINAYDKIFIEKNGIVKKTDKNFLSSEKYFDVIQRIVSDGGREVNLSNPIVDSRLKDGSRVNVVLPPISIDEPIMTIRKFSKETMTMAKLQELGAITEEASAFIERLIKAKYNIIICGGTGSGKTTFLNAASNYIPQDERIVCIEDSAELQIKGIDNLVRLETRNSNSSGFGEINMRDLIKTSLRMRPERIIIGEVRGKEAFDLIQALNTGHEGELCTGHSNSCLDMISRLETMAMMAEEEIPITAIRDQIISSIDILIYLSRLSDKSRKVLEISEVDKTSRNHAKINKIYEYDYSLKKLIKKNEFINTGKLIKNNI